MQGSIFVEVQQGWVLLPRSDQGESVASKVPVVARAEVGGGGGGEEKEGGGEEEQGRFHGFTSTNVCFLPWFF